MVGEADAAGDPVQGEANIVEVLIGAKPVVLHHTAGDFDHGRRHDLFVALQLLIDRLHKLPTLAVGKPAPVPQQEVVVENVQRHAGKAPALTGEQPLAGQHLRVLVGEAIDCQVVANAFQHRGWQGRPVHTPGEIPEDAAHTCLGGVRGEEGVGEVVHTQSSSASSTSSAV